MGGGVLLVVGGLLCLVALWAAPRLRNWSNKGFLLWVLAIVAAVPVAAAAFYAGGSFIYGTLGISMNGSDAMLYYIPPVVGAIAYLTYVGGAWGGRGQAGPEPEDPRAAAPVVPRPVTAPGAVPAAAAQPLGPPPDLFISYKRDERPEVLAIAARLEALKVKVWFDAEMRSGTTFDAEIDRNVRAAKCVLVCWSPGAVASDWVRGEATIGRERGVLAAALLKPCDLPAPFNLIHANDLRGGVGPANPEWLALLQRIGALLGRPGLASYEGLAQDRAAYASWMADNPNDPLFEQVVAKLRAL